MVYISELHHCLSRNSKANEYNVSRKQVNVNGKKLRFRGLCFRDLRFRGLRFRGLCFLGLRSVLSRSAFSIHPIKIIKSIRQPNR